MTVLLLSVGPSQQVLTGLIQTTETVPVQDRLAVDQPVVLHTPLRDKRSIDRLEGIVAIVMPGATNLRSSALRG